MNINDITAYFVNDEDLYISIQRALNDLYRIDIHLINNEPITKIASAELGKHYVGERAIVFRFAHYLQNELVKYPRYAKYNLDCEYNRKGIYTKCLPSFPNGTFPDLIIHQRGNNNKNLLVMEFKTYWNTNTQNDVNKVGEFVAKNGDYKYKYGIVVTIGKTLAETNFEVY